MSIVNTHEPGAFCWAEVGTIDPIRTKGFYAELFGWSYQDQPAGAFGVYSFCRLSGKALAGLYQLPPALLQQGVPPHWMSFVAVAEADSVCARIKQHGGTIEQGPFDVMELGRMAICKDPAGAVFSIWQAKTHRGMATVGETGTPAWFELATRGVEQAERFYVAVFGWQIKKGSGDGFDYREIHAPGSPTPMGGLRELSVEHGPVPPHWLIYFTVDDCDKDVQRAKSCGGRVYLPPVEIRHVGRFAVLADPAGASFAIIQLASGGAEKHAAASTPPALPQKPAFPAQAPAKKK